jgi:2-amino-4-hydroxy-6-hydroxymethyldihydropteridine diphosphokinase
VVRAALGLGSNLGDRRLHLAAGVAGLSRIGELVAVSSLYETEPIGGPPQDHYLNAVVVVDTELSARELLDAALTLETAAGRERRLRWEPRPLDIDLLLYGAVTIDEPGLTVPHARMAQRRFVLEPLAEAWPQATLPDGTPAADLLAGVADQQVEVVAGPGWWC